MIALSPQVLQLAAVLRPALGLAEVDQCEPITPAMIGLAVERHRVAPLLHRAAKLGGKPLPEGQADALAMRSRDNARQALRQQAASLAFGGVLAQAGIAHAEIKGWRLGQLLYHGEALRQAKDVDLLVDPAGMEEALRLAQAEGYHDRRKRPLRLWHARAELRFHRETGVRDPRSGVEIELHSRALEAPPQAWSDAALLHGQLDLSCPAYVLYLLLHGAGTKWNRLKWLCDLARIAQLVSPEVRGDVVALARRCDCLPALAASFRLLAMLWGEELAADWRAALAMPEDDPRASAHLAEFAEALDRDGAHGFTTLTARRAELVRDTPLFGTRHPPRIKAIGARSALWLLRQL
ncbi:MAG: nucleotidyltransferase family protein [Erythrobacter sp.]|nr:nucleotidyltransferase family protein [Erythrobacter sp.]